MYLSILNEDQKNLFLDVCIYLSKTDGRFANEEEKLLYNLCDEMHIEYRNETYSKIDDAIKKLSSSSNKKIKRMLILELIGIVFADGVIEKVEIDFVKNVIKEFGLDEEEFEEAFGLVERLYNVYGLMHNYVER